METKSKTSIKVISLFLSVLMALSCFSMAMPNLALKADAAASSAQITALSNALTTAYNAGYMSTGAYTTGGTQSVTINDTTQKGYIYNCVVAMYDIINAEKGTTATAAYNHNTTLRARLKALVSMNSYQQSLVDAVLPVSGNYVYYVSNQWQQESGANGSTPAVPFAAMTLSATVTRSVKAAILNSYTTTSAVPASVNTKLVISYNASVSTATSTRSSGWSTTTGSGTNKTTNSGTDYYYTRTAYYYNSSIGGAYTTSATPNLAAITNYLNYTNSSDFKTGYNAYVADSASIYGWTVANLQAVESGYSPYRTALNSIDTDYLNLFIGNTVITKYDTYVDACVGAATAAQYKKYVDWVMYDGSIDGYSDADDYNAASDDPAMRQQMVYLRETATTFKGIMEGLTTGVTDALVAFYGYDTSAYTNYISALTDCIQQYDLRQIKYAVDSRINGTTGDLYNGDASLFGVSEYESYVHGTVVDDEMLQAAYDWFYAKYNAVTAMLSANITAVFGDSTASYVKSFRDALSTEIKYRNRETQFTSYYDYFEGVFYIDYSTYRATAIESFIATAETKLAELNTLYNTTVTEVGSLKAGQIFGNYLVTIQAYIEGLYDILYQRSYNQLKYMEDCYGTGVTALNFSLVKRAIAGIDEDLYSYIVAHSSAYSSSEMSTLTAMHNHIEAYKAAVEAQIASIWSGYQTIQLDGGTGTYTVRYAREDDMVRDVNDNDGDIDDYTVTESKINTVISKLDSFITSDDFAKLIGAYDEEAGIRNLSDYIDSLLTDLLFNDGMVNTIVALIFPMLADLLVNTILDLLNGGLGDLSTNPYDSNADGAISLSALSNTLSLPDSWAFSVRYMNGTVDLYLNGKKGTKTLPYVFAQLGLNLHPQYFANSLASTANAGRYASFISALRSAGDNWLWFDSVANGGNGNGEVDKEDLERFTWNVTDYNSFCVAIGDVFSAVLPILKVLFTNYTYTTVNVENLVYANVPNGSVGYKVLGINGSTSVKTDGYNINTYITLSGVQGYNNLWAPIFESLGVTSSQSDYTTGYGVNDISESKPLSTSFGTSGNSATAAQFANALFRPLMALVSQLANGPIDKLLSILPNVAQYVSYNLITPLLDSISTNINLKAGIHLNEITGSTLSDIIDWFRGSINDSIANAVNTDIALELGSLVDLEEMLGFDLSDLNALLDFILGKALTSKTGEDLEEMTLPNINAGRVASLGSLGTKYSIRTTNNYSIGVGRRHFITADKADVFYDVIQWVLDFVATDGNLSRLLTRFGADDLGEEINTVLGGINAEDALAALVEMFLPQEYSMQSYDWYVSNEEGSHYNLDASSFVYLTYANNWTQQKADYFYNNLDDIVNTVIDMVKPELLAEYGGINEMILDKVNSIFNNEGIMNVMKLVTGLGDKLADKPEIVGLVEREAGVDLLAWYETFGYLYEDYYVTDQETGVTTGPASPGDADYINNFPSLSVTTTVAEDGTTEYHWVCNGTPLIDGDDHARQTFTDIFCALIIPFSPVLDLIFTGKDLTLFNGSLVIGGYDCYQTAIIPLFEILGITDLKTQAQYESYVVDNGSEAGFNYLVAKLFDRVTDLLTVETLPDGTTYGPIQKLVNLLPSVFYALQSDGLSTLLKNVLHPVWILVDTLRPVVDVDLDDFVHQFLCMYLGLVYDKTSDTNYASAPLVDLILDLLDEDKFEVPPYSSAQAAEDKPLVDGIYQLTVEDLSLETVYYVINTMFGLDLSPLSYAFEGMCCSYEKNGTEYGIYDFTSKSGSAAKGLNYYGPDTITVTISALLDVLRFGDNAAALDKLIGLVKDRSEDIGSGIIDDDFTVQGLLEALLTVFEDKVADFGVPNWDYLLEGKTVNSPIDGNGAAWVDGDYTTLQEYSDLSMYHSINNLRYLTDWTYDTASATDTMLTGVLDYVASLIDENYTSFSAFIDGTLNDKVFTGEILKTLAGLIAKLYNLVPQNIVALIDNLLDINLTAWYEYVELVNETETDADGNEVPTGKQIYAAKENYKWWDSENAEYVTDRDGFLEAIKTILMPADKIISFIFLGENYNLFYTIDNGPDAPGYGDDAIVINGANAYAYGTVPILEALGVDLTGYEPSKYVTTGADGKTVYNPDLFIDDLFEVFVGLFDDIIHDPLSWVVNALPGVVYFINASGVSTCIKNIFGSVQNVIDVVNSQLDSDSLVDLSTLIKDFDLSNITLANLFGLLETYLGIHITPELTAYMQSLYVGDISYFQSVNGTGAFTMTYNNEEDRADMITIAISLIVEILTDSGEYENAEGETVAYDNAAAIDKLLSKEGEEPSTIVSSIVSLLKNPEDVHYKDINWNYFDETFELSEATGAVTVPGYAFQYLNYTTDWTYDKAAKTAEGFEKLLVSVLNMTGSETTSIKDLVSGIIDLDNFYTGANLQKVLDLVSGFLYGEKAILNESILSVLGFVLGADLTQWNYEYAFETTGDYSYTLEAETGLSYRYADVLQEVPPAEEGGEPTYEPTGETIKTYGISDRASFVTGLTVMLQPAYRLLSWLLFGEGYEFFNSNIDIDEVLINVLGGNGYKEGLALLLEALGCTNLKYADSYKNADGSYDIAACLDDIVNSICNRVDEMISDPVYQLTSLIPELIYFINAGGLQTVIGNLLAAPLNLVNAVSELTGNEGLSVDALVTDALQNALNSTEVTFAMDDINLGYIFDLAEKLTGLEITDVVGNSLSYFYMGQLNCYASKSGKLAYKMSFSTDEDFADFITILLSAVVDIALYDGNAAALETLLKLDTGLVSSIVNTIRTGWTVDVDNIDWFYFDETYGQTLVDGNGAVIDNASNLSNMPVRTINYLTYASDWTEETADYIYSNRNSVISAALKLATGEDSTVAEIIAKSFSLNEDLYTAENLNKILTAVKGLTGNFDAAILDLLGLVLDVDLTAWDTMGEFTATDITDRKSFVNGLTAVLTPIFPVLDWLLFGKDFTFFDKKTDVSDPESEIEVLISLPGSEGYAYGIVPLLEVLGVSIPAVTAEDTTESSFFVLVNNVLARVEAILANPVDEALALLPNLLYFINTNGISTCVNNLLSGVFALLDAVNPILGENAIDINALLSQVFEGTDVTLDLDNLDLLALTNIVEQVTGVEITDILTENKIDNFYLGKLEYFTSANGKPAFRMNYSDEQSAADMLTIIVNLAIEVLLYDGNAAAIDTLIGQDGTVQNIVKVLNATQTVEYIDLDWNYFDESVTLGDITVPANAFVYLNYSNDWTYEKAAYLDAGLNNLINEVLTLTGSDAASVSELLSGLVDLNTVFNAENLNKILDLVAGYLYGENAVLDSSLLELLGIVLGGDLTEWNRTYAFEDYDAAMTYTEDTEVGLSYRDVDGIKTYAIDDTDDFINGIAVVLQPAEKLLSWLLLGNSYNFFVDNTTGADTLININGSDGYARSISVLLEALGCKSLKVAGEYTSSTTLIKDVATSVVNRISEILANPVDEILALIPEIIYFINAGGLNSVVNNLAGSVLNLLKELEPFGVHFNIDELVTGLLRDAVGNDTLVFSLANVNLQYVFEVAEMLTGIEITDAIGYSLKDFAIGEVVKYDSVSDYVPAYKMQFAATGDGTDAARDRADMITIALSVVLDVLMYKDAENSVDNAAVVEALIGDAVPAGTIDLVIAAITGYTTDMMDIDWFYFDDTVDVSTITADTALTMPGRTINYLSYASNWTEETAQYLNSNLDNIIASVLKLTGSEETTVAEIIAKSFTLDQLYTAENLNKIKDLVANLVSQLSESILNVAGMLVDVNLTAWSSMNFNAAEITDRQSFVAGLTEIVTPVASLLDWLLFGNDYSFFSKLDSETTNIDDLITINGAEGYAYGLVPLLEALGVRLPAITAESNTANMVEAVLNATLIRAEAILADPVNEVLALIPNLLYFINANGFAASVNNLAHAALNLLDKVNPILVSLGNNEISVNDLINDALPEGITIDITNLDLLAIVDVIEKLTGLEIVNVVTADKLDKFFIGQIKYYQSSNGKAAFKMVYSTEEDRADMITILINFLVEVALYEGNPAAIDTLANTNGIVTAVVDLLGMLATGKTYETINWNYFGGTVDAESNITLPEQPFKNYLTYVTDWTQSKADYIYDNLDNIINAVLRMTGKDETADTVAKIIANSFSLYKAEYLNAILTLVQNIYTALDNTLLKAAGIILSVDLTQWEGLTFTDAEVYDADTFRAGLVEILSPVFSVLDWLLFGKDYTFFVDNGTGTENLITIKGNEGYKEGLVPLLEGLGVNLPLMTANASCVTMFDSVLKAVFARVDAILANPVDEALALLPNIIYFINANGASVAVTNLVGSIFNIVESDELKALGVNVDINDLLGGFDVQNISLESLCKLAEEKTGLTIYSIFDTENGNLLSNFYLGKITKFLSTNGYTAYSMGYADTDADRGDLLTMLLSIVLEVALYDDNATVLDDLLGLNPGSMDAIKALLAGCAIDVGEINWVYFLGLDEEARQVAVDAALAAHTNELPALPDRTTNRISYLNNWTEETIEYIDTNLTDIVDLVISLVTESSDLNTLINTELDLYSDATVDKLVGYVANALSKLDAELQDAIGCLLDVDLEALRNYKANGVHDKATFTAALTEAFGTLDRLLDWVLFGQEYTFFTELEDGTQATITLNGGYGFNDGLVPVLEALGVDFTGLVIPEASDDVTITERVLNEVLTKVCDRIDVILADPINEVLALLPNLIYFINADGVSVSATNLTAPIDALLEAARPVAGDEELSLSSLIGFDLGNLDFAGICQIVLDKTGIDVYGAIGEYLSMFYFGRLDYFQSYNGDGAFRMVYTDTEERHDMITILVSLVLEVFEFTGNKDALVKLIGENAYIVIMAFLHGNEEMVDMQDFSWILTEYANTGKVLSPMTFDGLYDYIYGPLYTRAMGEYISKWFPDFVDTMIVLLGIKDKSGTDIFDSLEDLLDEYLGNTIYTNDNLTKIYDLIKGLVEKLDGVAGIEYIKAVVKASLDIDLDYWNGYTVNTITDGDRTAFVAEICRMVRPVYPILNWLLTSDNIAFFADDEAQDYVVIKGAEGYAEGIIPILEALRSENVLTPEEYEAAADADQDNLIKNIVNPILDRVDILLADPTTEIFVELPSVIYFVNSNGLDTSFRNLLNAVYSVLDTIKPLTGEINLYSVLFGEGFDLATIDFEYLLDLLLTSIEDSTGFKLSEVACEAIKELTLGTVRSFTSKNGDLAYTMDYTTGGDKVDLATVTLRFALTFISIQENADALKAMLNGKLSEDGYKFVCVLLDNFSQMARDPDGMDKIMYTVYQIFYAANVAAQETNNWLTNFNGDYSFLSQLFTTSDVAFLRQLGNSIASILDKYTGDIIDSDGLASNGLISFFQKIQAFFQKIIDFFQNLFK